jgi:uncharacterized protein (TIGR00290 family)
LEKEPPVNRAVLSWSGGKDSALSLYEMQRKKKNFEVVSLITTVTQDYERISMHGVRRELLTNQSKALRLNVAEVRIPKGASNEIYEEQFKRALLDCKARGVKHVAFGDLFLQDIRSYRENLVNGVGMECLFPIWGKDTRKLGKFFVDSGFKAVICCVDPAKLAMEYCGREFDERFLSDLPQNVDPCGENGEFHTFVYAGPIFDREIRIRVGDIVRRDAFYFADILVRD